MMKCIICGKAIKPTDFRTHVMLFRDNSPLRKLFACGVCGVANGPFDRLIDALPTGDNDCPREVSRTEIEALILATDPKRLEKRLREARSTLPVELRKRFGRGRFDSANRQLIGNNGVVLKWRTRVMPDRPVSDVNLQTNQGHVSLEAYTTPPVCED